MKGGFDRIGCLYAKKCGAELTVILEGDFKTQTILRQFRPKL